MLALVPAARIHQVPMPLMTCLVPLPAVFGSRIVPPATGALPALPLFPLHICPFLPLFAQAIGAGAVTIAVTAITPVLLRACLGCFWFRCRCSCLGSGCSGLCRRGGLLCRRCRCLCRRCGSLGRWGRCLCRRCGSLCCRCRCLCHWGGSLCRRCRRLCRRGGLLCCWRGCRGDRNARGRGAVLKCLNQA